MAGELILVIDDHELNLKLLRTLLERRGFRVNTATDAAEAWRSVRAEKPDLILMDIQLPGTDGLELTRQIKADPEFGGVAIVAVTSRAMKGDMEKTLAAGCDAYVSKPFESGTLLAIMRSRLAKSTC